jgi:hypothetical protein
MPYKFVLPSEEDGVSFKLQKALLCLHASRKVEEEIHPEVSKWASIQSTVVSF